jgi:dolichol-phosphate mannosyltransferase
VIVPADHQFDARDLKQLLEARTVADVVGSFRLIRRDTPARRMASRLYNAFMRRVFGIPLRDLNWVKMFRRSILEQFEIESKGWAVDAEIVLKAQRLGCRIVEVPVEHHDRTWGQPTGLSARNVTRTAREVWRLRAILQRMKARHESAAEVGRHRDPARDPSGVAGVAPRALSDPGPRAAPDRGPRR